MPRAFPHATVTHSTSARHRQTVPVSARLHRSAPGAVTPRSAAPHSAVLPATALPRPRLLLDLRSPELPRAKYSINYDIKKNLVMTLSFFFPGTIMSSPSEGKHGQVFPWHLSLPPLPSGCCPCALQRTLVSCCVTLCVCLCCVGKEQSFK